jgi:hypothetical protein
MNNKRLLGGLGVLVVTALACAIPGVGGDSGSGSGALFEDDFSNEGNGWDTFEGDNAKAGYDNGEYVLDVFPTSWFVWANPEGASPNLSNVRIEVTARNAGSATEPGFGIMCNYQDEQNTYYMGVSVDGYYVIAKTVGGSDTVLSHADSWAQSEDIPLNASSYRVRAECGNGTLTLYVGDTQLASVSDTTFSSGNVGLFAQTFDEGNAQIRFDDIVANALE